MIRHSLILKTSIVRTSRITLYIAANQRKIPKWVFHLTLGATILQCFILIILFVAVSKRNRKTCSLWLFITLTTCLLNGFILCLYQMLIISKYSFELKLEKNENRTQHLWNISEKFNKSVIQASYLLVPIQNSLNQTKTIANRNQPELSYRSNFNNGSYNLLLH